MACSEEAQLNDRVPMAVNTRGIQEVVRSSTKSQSVDDLNLVIEGILAKIIASTL